MAQIQLFHINFDEFYGERYGGGDTSVDSRQQNGTHDTDGNGIVFVHRAVLGGLAQKCHNKYLSQNKWKVSTVYDPGGRER